MYRVLLVDDEAIARTGLRSTFEWEKKGFQIVGEASNGQKAMKWIENNEVDILITDIAMPVMCGLELTRKTRELCPRVKVLLLSCHNDFHYVREGLRLGASDYLLKPTMETEDLEEVLEKMKVQIEKEKEFKNFQQAYQNAEKAVQPQLFHGSAGAGNLEVEEENRFHQRVVQTAMKFINAHYTEIVSLQDAADHVSMSKNYFSELFKRVTGQNFIDYLIQLRLNRAKELLKTTTLKIYEVADISGFNDVKYFSKLFKKVENMCPAEYRELHSFSDNIQDYVRMN